MNFSCFFFLVPVFAFAATAPDPAMQRKNAEAGAARNGVEAVFDQPYAGNDNPKQRVDLYLPKERKSEQPLPVVVFIHGGGWVHGDRIGSAAGAIKYAHTGEYAAVAVGYRLTNEAHWPEQIYDCKAAIRWIRGHAKQYHLDPAKIAVMGSSAGGHLVSLLGTSGGVRELEGTLGEWTSESSRVTCVVNLCGPEDLTKALMFDKQGAPIVNDAAVVGLLGGTSEERHAEAVAASPLTYVTPDDPPFLNIQGTKDARVAFANAEAIHAALKKAGVPSLLVPITDGGHGSTSNPEAQHRAEQFIAKYLRGIPAEISTEPIPDEKKTEPGGK
jgi:acetyl esterase/lipase